MNKLPLKLKMLIDGQQVDASSKQSIERHSPAHGTLVSTSPAGSAADVDTAVQAAVKSFESGVWAQTTGAERATVLNAVADLLAARIDEIAKLEALESGKPISQARDEVNWTIDLWKHAAALCRSQYGDSCNTLGESKLAMTLREPIGVVGLIVPWNFPLLIASQKLPYALGAGCSCVLKPSELTPSSALILGNLLQEAGLPAGVLNIVTGYGDPVGKRLAEHEDVDMISFTGSTKVGKSIAAAAAGNLKKVSLELGGKNPLIIFDDADLELAVDCAKLGAFFNQGECCNASSRVLVQDSIADSFVEKLQAATASLKVGDPLDPQTKIGAIINEQQQEKILDYIATSDQCGARLVTGGKAISSDQGLYIEKTLIDHVRPDMAIASEEVFGPVLSIIRFKDSAEALEIANGTSYGLSAGVFTKDYETALNMSRRLRAGTVWVNTWLEGANELSFGGYKQSGLGRELGQHAIEEFTEAKTIQFHMGNRQPWW